MTTTAGNGTPPITAAEQKSRSRRRRRPGTGRAGAGAEATGALPGVGRAGTAREPKGPGSPVVATPWGGAALVAEATVEQRAGERRFRSAVQLLVDARGEPLVRFAYATAGRARRGPVTLRARDLDRLRAAAAKEPLLSELVGWGPAAPPAHAEGDR